MRWKYCCHYCQFIFQLCGSALDGLVWVCPLPPWLTLDVLMQSNLFPFFTFTLIAIQAFLDTPCIKGLCLKPRWDRWLYGLNKIRKMGPCYFRSHSPCLLEKLLKSMLPLKSIEQMHSVPLKDKSLYFMIIEH